MGDLKYQAENLRQIANAIEGHICPEGRQNLIVIHQASKHREKLTRNFYIGEFMSRDGATLILIDKRLAEGLQKIREMIGRPIVITSGFRTPEHNQAIGGAEESRHKTGQAVDCRAIGMSGDELATYARRVGFNGIGIAKNWIHCDVREIPAEWRY